MTKKKVLEQFTRPKVVKDLKSQVEIAKSRELTARAALEREQAVRGRLMDQIAGCKVHRPRGRPSHLLPSLRGRRGESARGSVFRLIPAGAPRRDRSERMPDRRWSVE